MASTFYDLSRLYWYFWLFLPAVSERRSSRKLFISERLRAPQSDELQPVISASCDSFLCTVGWSEAFLFPEFLFRVRYLPFFLSSQLPSRHRRFRAARRSAVKRERDLDQEEATNSNSRGGQRQRIFRWHEIIRCFHFCIFGQSQWWWRIVVLHHQHLYRLY